MWHNLKALSNRKQPEGSHFENEETKARAQLHYQSGDCTSKSLRSPNLRATFTHNITYYRNVKRLKFAGHARKGTVGKAAVFPLEAVPFEQPIPAKRARKSLGKEAPTPLTRSQQLTRFPLAEVTGSSTTSRPHRPPRLRRHAARPRPRGPGPARRRQPRAPYLML